MSLSKTSPLRRVLPLEHRPRWLLIVTPALVTLMAAGWAGSISPEPPLDPGGFWKPGVPVPIAVKAGTARFKVPTPDPSADTLVVISTLSRATGPFEMSLRALPTNLAGVPALERESLREPHVPAPAMKAAAISDKVPEFPPSERLFHIMVQEGDSASPRNYTAVRGLLRGVGRRVQVYLDSSDTNRDDDVVVKDLVTCFDDQIFHRTAERYGAARDVDGDGRFTILLSSWLDHLGGGQHSVDGFIRMADFDPTIPEPVSNRCDMMYLNSRLKSSAYLRTVVAHEYMHAVVSTQKGGQRSLASPSLIEEEGWLDEAIAHLAEDQHGFTRSNIDYRVSAFLSRPERYQLVVEDYYRADLFRSHGNRGSTYLFLKWCVERYGETLLPALIGSSKKGVDNLEAATGASFTDLYRRWSVALFLSGWNSGEDEGLAARDDTTGLHLREPWDDWEMAGPRTSRIAPGDRPEQWVQLGTTSHFAVIGGSSTGAVEIEVIAPADAQLQVTALPLGSKMPRLELSAVPITRADGDLQVVLRVNETHGVPARISAISWEMLTPGPNPHADGFVRGRLDMLGVASKLGTSALPAHGELTGQPISLKGLGLQPGAVVFKLTATDSAGHRVAAWAELGPRQIATRSEP